MTQGAFTKVSAKNAAEVCGLYDLSIDAQKLLQEHLAPRQFVERLVEAERHFDALEFLAHALPKREAIWWACLAVRHAQGAELPSKESVALKATVEWVLEPDEGKRRAAQAAGEAADFGTPAGCAALAVYGSGGSLTPPNLPEAPPEPTMTAKAVSGCLALAAAKVDPADSAHVQRQLVELGIAIAEGGITLPVVTKTRAKSPAAPPPGQRT
jgi:hypothetical protein